jgi:hypothetical protein
MLKEKLAVKYADGLQAASYPMKLYLSEFVISLIREVFDRRCQQATE